MDVIFMTTESKVTIALSVLALAMAGGQNWSAHEANSLNKEKITIEALSSNNPSTRVGATTCWGNGVTSIELNWQVTIFNNSTQPVTIKELNSVATSPIGPSAKIVFLPTGPIKPQFPVLIEAKSFKTFQVPITTRTSPEFGLWFKQNGGCDGRPIWPSAEARLRFDETGWKQYGSTGAMFTAVSGGGESFFIQSVWR